MYRLRLGGLRWPALIAAWAVAATVLGGCDRTEDPGTPDASTPLSSTGQENPGGPGQEGADGDLAWVPFGPNDPAIPDYWPAYKYFAHGECSALQNHLENLDVGDFGIAMVAVCLAAVDGQQDQWDVAESHAGADATRLGNPCLAGEIKKLLDRALAWHRLHPAQKPNVQFQRVEDRMACARPETEPPEPEQPPTTEQPPQTDPPTTTEQPPETEGLSHTGDPAEPTR